MKRLFLLLALFCTVLPAQADSLKTVVETRELSRAVLKFMLSGQIAQGLAALDPYWSHGREDDKARRKEKVEETGRQRLQVRLESGELVDFLYIDSIQVKDSLLRHRFIERRERYPVIWKFDFYQANDGWKLINVEWDDKYGAVLEKP